jgi:hypothetical protein
VRGGVKTTVFGIKMGTIKLLVHLLLKTTFISEPNIGACLKAILLEVSYIMKLFFKQKI